MKGDEGCRDEGVVFAHGVSFYTVYIGHQLKRHVPALSPILDVVTSGYWTVMTAMSTAFWTSSCPSQQDKNNKPTAPPHASRLTTLASPPPLPTGQKLIAAGRQFFLSSVFFPLAWVSPPALKTTSFVGAATAARGR